MLKRVTKTKASTIPKVKVDPLIFIDDEKYDGSSSVSVVMDTECNRLLLGANHQTYYDGVLKDLPLLINNANRMQTPVNYNIISSFVRNAISQQISDILYCIINDLNFKFKCCFDKCVNSENLQAVFSRIGYMYIDMIKQDADYNFFLLDMMNRWSKTLYDFYRNEIYTLGHVEIDGRDYPLDALWAAFQDEVTRDLIMMQNALVAIVQYFWNMNKYLPANNRETQIAYTETDQF